MSFALLSALVEADDDEEQAPKGITANSVTAAITM
jgi:hypothetical protein